MPGVLRPSVVSVDPLPGTEPSITCPDCLRVTEQRTAYRGPWYRLTDKGWEKVK
jgi:hypothetical protein